MANQEQLARLKLGVGAWNKWREKNPDFEIDLRASDLNGARLSRVDLMFADLEGVHLRESDLSRADLFGADLNKADLSGANLLRGELSQANLFEANLGKAFLVEADLSEADLTWANLKGAILREADLIETNLRGANLGRADLREAFLVKADLGRANLSGANLNGAKLRQADLRGAYLRDARLIGADLTGADLRRADLGRADLRGANLREADLRGADVTGAYFRGADFTGAFLTRADFIETDLIDLESGLANSIELPESEDYGAQDGAEDGESFGENIPDDPDELDHVGDEISFTAIYPKEGRVETWHTLLVYAHLLSAVEEVHKDAQRFKDQILVPKEVRSTSWTPIAHGTELTIVPSCDRVVFNPERLTLKWMEDYHRAEFRFRADISLAEERVAGGEINIYAGPVLIGIVEFVMLLNETDAQHTNEEHSLMYHQEDIFMSYSHKDTAVVLAFQKAYEALGFNILIDRDTLRSGQVWDKELIRMIDRATIFQLFWSQNSSESKYCRKEWKHALKRRKEGFIRPVYWEVPMPEPPKELRRYHFEQIQL